MKLETRRVCLQQHHYPVNGVLKHALHFFLVAMLASDLAAAPTTAPSTSPPPNRAAGRSSRRRGATCRA